jgi:hypothetical protein
MNYTYTVDQYFDEVDSPRDWDNLGTMVCWHRKYTLGDEQPMQEPSDWARQFNLIMPNAIILPLYLYDHSGITISTTPFNCSWDSGQVGYIYTTLERAQEMGFNQWKRLTKKRRDQLAAYLIDEVKTYDQYIRGEVYRFTIEDEDGNYIYSGGGYYGRDDCEKEAREFIDGYLTDDRKAA